MEKVTNLAVRVPRKIFMEVIDKIISKRGGDKDEIIAAIGLNLEIEHIVGALDKYYKERKDG